MKTLFNSSYLIYFFSWDVIVFFIFTTLYFIGKITKRGYLIADNFGISAIAIGFVNLGLMFGLFSGLSQSPVVGILITSFLTLFGSLITYLTIKDKENATRISSVALLGLILIPIFLVYGMEIGVRDRIKYEDSNRVIDLAKEKALQQIKNGTSDQIIISIPADSLPDINLK